MRMSAKAEYAVRAMVQLATVDEGVLVKTEDLAKAQGIPAQFLVDILSDLRTDRLVRSHRGRDGGYELARAAADISLADVLRCIDGPLASVRDIGLGDLPYSGPTAALTDVWRALRASMRSVLERTSHADVASGALPAHVAKMADITEAQLERSLRDLLQGEFELRPNRIAFHTADEIKALHKVGVALKEQKVVDNRPKAGSAPVDIRPPTLTPARDAFQQPEASHA